MPRQLPWALKGDSAERRTASPASSASHTPAPARRPNPRLGNTPTPRAGQSPATIAKRPRSGTEAYPNRSPSTSPPPQPVSEEFMIDGVDQDDGYRMVEDEFLSVAGDFTKHLHAAEYHRLRALAKEENADTIRTISRPVTGNITELVRRRQKVMGLAASQRRGIRDVLKRGVNGDTDDDDQPWAGTSLQGLMNSPRKAMPLMTTAYPTARKRASPSSRERTGPPPRERPQLLHRRLAVEPRATGRSRDALPRAPEQASSTDSGDDEDDDLDAPSIPLTISTKRRDSSKAGPSTPTMASARDGTISALQENGSSRPEATSTPTSRSLARMSTANPFRPKPLATASSTPSKPIDLTQDDDDDEDFFTRRQNERDQKRRRGNTTTLHGHLDDIPFI